MPYKDVETRRAYQNKKRAMLTDEDRERIGGYKRAWAERNRDRIASYAKAHRPEERERRKERRANDPAWAKKERDRAAAATSKRLSDPVKRRERREYQRAWIASNLNRIRELQKRERINLRMQVLKHYGGKCVCCGEETFEFLAIDHINGGGTKHRKEIFGKNWRGGTGQSMCRWLRKNGFPKGFQVLCHNCNSAKGFYGQCPHERERQWNEKSAS